MSEKSATLPVSVAKEDRRLEKAVSGASELLAELRWHWTLDESHAKRVSFRAYARGVGKTDMTIRQYAHGYAEWIKGARTGSLTDSIKRAAMSSEREAATDAVAKAHGVTFGTAKSSRPTEVRRVLQAARDKVEAEGGTVEEHVRAAADWTTKSERADQRQSSERARRSGMRFVRVEAFLVKARRNLEEALSEGKAVEWDDEQLELLQHTLGSVRSLLDLIDASFAGEDIDWDAELAALESERNK